MQDTIAEPRERRIKLPSRLNETFALYKQKIDFSKLDGFKQTVEKKRGWQLFRQYFLDREAGRWFLWLVALPWLVAAFYYGVVASDRYVSNATFMIEENGSNAASFQGMSILGMTPHSGNDEKILENFIRSDDMLLYLDQELNLKQHYQETGDWISSLPGDASREDFLSYFREHLSVRYDETNGLLNLEVQGFEPAFTETLADAILNRSESFVNDISHTLAYEQQAFVMKEVAMAEQRMKDSLAKLVAYQKETGMLSPEAEGAALSGIMTELQGELVRSKAELRNLQSYLNPNTAKVVTLKQKIAALEQQLSAETRRLTGSGGDLALNDLTVRYKELQLENEIAKQVFTSALVALESARTEASRKLKHLVVVSSPFVAEDAKYPRVGYILASLLIVLLMVYGIVRMVRATIREHQD